MKARTRTCTSHVSFGRTLTGASMTRTRTDASMARTRTYCSQISFGRSLTGCSMASLEEEIDFLLNSSAETVQEIVHNPPQPEWYESIQPEIVLLDASRGSVEGVKAASRLPGAVLLNVYDLSENFRKANEILTFSWENIAVGGAFHVGVEVFGTEWFFGSVGVTSTLPRVANGHVYNSSVCLGVTPLDKVSFAAVLHNMCQEWRGADYQLISRNCCAFATAFCGRLGTNPLPPWISRVPYVLDTGRRVSVDAMDKWREVQSQMAMITSSIMQEKPVMPKTSDRAGSPDFRGPRVPKNHLPKHPGDKSDVNDAETQAEHEPLAENGIVITALSSQPHVVRPVLLGRVQTSSLPSGPSQATKLGSQTRGRRSVSFAATAVIDVKNATLQDSKPINAKYFGQAFESNSRSLSPPCLRRTIPAFSPVVAQVEGGMQSGGATSNGFKFMARSVSPPPLPMAKDVESCRPTSPRPSLARRASGQCSPPAPTTSTPNSWTWPVVSRQTSGHCSPNRSPSPLHSASNRRSFSDQGKNHFTWAPRDVRAMTS